MADLALQSSVAKAAAPGAAAWSRLRANRDWLGFWFMLPAAAFLILFLAYPLGLGVWLSFTDARLGRGGQFIGLENYEYLWDDSTFWLTVFNTLLYTTVASTIKFAVGLYLALLLNERLPFKAILRAVVLIPFIVPTVLSAIAVAAFSPTEPSPPAVSERFAASRNGSRFGSSVHIGFLS
jgi:multiple sugar transport system permease protein